MVKIRGTSYRPLVLPELGDTVYFGQVKVFQDSQLEKSPTLKAAIAEGRVVVLEKMDTVEQPVSAQYIPPPASSVTVTVAPTTVPVPVPAASPSPTAPVEPPPAMSSAAEQLLASLVDKVGALAKSMEDKHTREAVGVSADVATQLSALASKIDGIRVSGPGVQEPSFAPSGAAPTDFTYVPSAIKVDDLSNNVSLTSRNLGQGGSVNEAVAALKRARQASASAQQP